MKQFFISTILFFGLGMSTAFAQNVSKELDSLKEKQLQLSNEITALKGRNAKAESRISELESVNNEFAFKVDSLQGELDKLLANQKADKSELTTSIDKTNEKVQATEANLSSRTLWGIGGIVVLILTLVAIVCAFLKKFKSGSTSIDEIKKAQSSMEDAQEQLRKAQEKMQEESVKLDNKLIEVLSKQSVSEPTTNEDGEVDHSLALKVADEIVRIETNLSRMDFSIKGYKQLSKAVERIRNNFNANGYEISDMLNKPYNAGMKCIADFVPNESLEPGQQIITGIIKPQVLYKGVMIQAAQITVSQNI